MSIEQRVLLVLGLAMIAGCAGVEAMRWKGPPPKPCGIIVCESRVGRIDYERDCFCSGSNSLPEIL